MRKTLVYFVILAVLCCGVYYFLFAKKESAYSMDEAGFTVKDTAAIGKIFIAGPDGNSVLVERTDSGWVVDKKYKALKGTINVLLKVLTQQAPLYPVPRSLHNTVVTTLAGGGIKVELDNRKGEKMRVFYIGGEATDFNGSYMLMEGAKQPYLVNVPGFQGYLAPYYSYKLGDWRDRTVFDLKPDQIKSISVQYPELPVNSFVIRQENGKAILDANKELASSYALNQHRVNSYVKFFENVNCEGYITSDNTMDSLLRVMPKHAVVDLTSIKGEQRHLDVYWMPISRKSKNLTAIAPEVPDNKYDAERFFAVENNYKDTIMIQVNTFNKIFRKAYEFYQPDPVPDTSRPAAVQVLPKAVKK